MSDLGLLEPRDGGWNHLPACQGTGGVQRPPKGMGVAGAPLFDATYSFEIGNNCQQRDLPLFGVLQWQKCGSFFFLWGV